MSQPSGIGARVRTLRRREGLSQVSLAKVLGVSASYVNLIEHDRRRLPADLMFRLADALHVDVREFATDEVGTLRSELMAVLDHPVFEGTDVRAIDVKELAQQQPDIARALVLLYRRWRSSEEALEKLGSLVVGGAGLATEATRLPSEEVNDLVQRNLNYFPDVEAAAEAMWRRHKLGVPVLFEALERMLRKDHDVVVRIARGPDAGLIRRFDPERRELVLAETAAPRSWHFQMAHQLGLLTLGDVLDRVSADPQLTTDASRRMCRMVLANYFAGALLMPYEPLLVAAEEVRYDVELLGHRFRTSFEQVCHRLTSLRRPDRPGVPFHFVKTDTAGNVSKRFSGSGIAFAPFSGGCPRWNVCTAFQHAGRIRTQLSEMPDGSVYFCLARSLEKRHGGYRSPESVYAVGIGCRVEHAHRVVYADGLDLSRAEVVPIGTSCRVCDRLECEQRAFPSIRHPLSLDENTRRVAFYGMSKD
jgi:predicted transcriptional regulator/transcriptional regulator with XRE-family HTH domain